MIVDQPCMRFVKSSFSSQTGGNCVEVARLADGRRAVRDSKDRDGGVQIYRSEEWAAFIAAIRSRSLG